MAASGNNERSPAAPAADGGRAARPRKKHSRSILDANGRYIPVHRQPKSAREKAPKPEKEKALRPEPNLSTLIIKKKKKTKAEKTAAKSEHAITQQEIERFRKRKKIMSMREQGATIAQISEQMIASGETGCSIKSVFDHLVAGYKEAFEDYTVDYRTDLQIRLNQMYRVELTHFKRLCDPHLEPKDVENLTKAMERVWKRMDVLIDRIHDKDKQSSIKLDIPTDAKATVTTKIRVILPAEAEPDEEE